MTPKRPIIRYHGGKWKLADWIIAQFPAHRIYVEPYGGGGSVLLRKPRAFAEVYNDLGGEIVNLFRVVRDQGQQLRTALELTPFARDEFNLSYQASDDEVEQARRTLIRAFMGFGSNSFKPNRDGSIMRTGFRSNSNRSGTTPAQDWRNYPDALPVLIDRLRGVVIENRKAVEVMEIHDGPKTLHYVDPPYVPETRDSGGDYSHEMTDADHVDMAKTLLRLEGPVILSGYDCPLYREMFGSWTRLDKAAFADGARARTECLWLSPGVSHGPLFAKEAAE